MLYGKKKPVEFNKSLSLSLSFKKLKIHQQTLLLCRESHFNLYRPLCFITGLSDNLNISLLDKNQRSLSTKHLIYVEKQNTLPIPL